MPIPPSPLPYKGRGSYKRRHVRRAAVLGGITALVFGGTAGSGCGQYDNQPAAVPVAPGVVFRRDEAAGVQLLEVDLQTAAVQPVLVASAVDRHRNNFVGDARTVREWAERFGAIGGLNGGFFGHTYDDAGRRKQIVGLAIARSRVIAPGGMVSSTRQPGEKFLRAAIGFSEQGVPDIAWAAGALRGPIRRYAEPINPGTGTPWRVGSAVACGPRLFARGALRITDRDERLVSPGKLPRAFAAYDVVNGKPRRLLLGRANAMEFGEVARFLVAYFKRAHGTAPHDALCLDGGPSAQLVYRDGAILHDAEETGVRVPTAILLVPPKNQQR